MSAQSAASDKSDPPKSSRTMIWLRSRLSNIAPFITLLFLVVRGLPAMLLYRKTLPRPDRIALALFSAAALPLLVAITQIGLDTHTMRSEVAVSMPRRARPRRAREARRPSMRWVAPDGSSLTKASSATSGAAERPEVKRA